MAEALLHEPISAKQCRLCGSVKSLSAFPRHRRRRDGHDSACKVSVAAKGRAWYRRRQQDTDGLYSTYVAMKGRCHDERHQHYPQYGGRGIRVCEEWRRSFNAFREWAVRNGYQPGLQIDRIDNDKGYSPTNCRFVTSQENQRNKRPRTTPLRNNTSLTVEDVRQIRTLLAMAIPQREIARRFGVNHATIWAIKVGRTWTEVN